MKEGRLATLSFGPRKRACRLVALVGTPQLQVLDGPSNGLDGNGVTLVRALLDERRQAAPATVLATNDEPLAASLSAKRSFLVAGN